MVSSPRVVASYTNSIRMAPINCSRGGLDALSPGVPKMGIRKSTERGREPNRRFDCDRGSRLRRGGVGVVAASTSYILAGLAV